MALPYPLYVISTSGTDMEAQLPIAYGTALVLILIILLVNQMCIRDRLRADRSWYQGHIRNILR